MRIPQSLSSAAANGTARSGQAPKPEPLYDEAGPQASAMVESLRAFGYDLPTALADLIDNSITAGARNVWVHFHWDGADSSVSLRDDGCGMSEQQLVAAMRPGSCNPLEDRSPKDLGRFGLGLKTASFSQCRWLSVHTKLAGGAAATRCWNLDYIGECNEWRLLREAPDGSAPHLTGLDSTASGTIVLWQKLDRLVDSSSPDDLNAQDHFYAAADEVKRHLAMTFHDHLSGRGAIKLSINGHPVSPWDPFLNGHDATQRLPQEAFTHRGCAVKVTPFVLPHHTRLGDAEWKDTGGPRGWNAQQGFYIYRNRRLIVAGDWLGMGFGKEEHYKLARIRIDLTNEADADWHLDVKKSSARPPAMLREALRRTAQLTRKTASEVYRHRGARLMPAVGEAKLHLWEQRVRRGKRFYALNAEHPLMRLALESSGDPNALKALLRLIQETVPVPLISITDSENPRTHAAPFEQTSSHQIQAVMKQVYRALCEAGHTPADARRHLAYMDAFEKFPELIATLDESENEHVLLEDEGEAAQ